MNKLDMKVEKGLLNDYMRYHNVALLLPDRDRDIIFTVQRTVAKEVGK